MNTRRALAAVVAIAATLLVPNTTQAQSTDPGAPTPTLAPAPTPGGDVVHSWALGPAGSDDPSEPSDRSLLSYTADPGAVINDAVTLYNFGNVDLEFQVYATDAYNTDDGAVDLLSRSVPPTGVGSWVRLGADSVPVSAGNQVTIPIQVVVPDNARPGDHLGAVLASNATGGEGEGGVVALDRRTGTSLQIRVNGPITSDLAITELRSEYTAAANPLAGSVLVSYRIENRGDVRIGGTSNVSVGGPFGLAEQTLPPVEFSTLLPGEEIVVTTEIDSVPATGFVTTEVEVVPETSGDDVALQTVTRSTTSFAPPISLMLLLLAGVFGLLAVRAVRRHRHRELDEAVPPMPDREPQLT